MLTAAELCARKAGWATREAALVLPSQLGLRAQPPRPVVRLCEADRTNNPPTAFENKTLSIISRAIHWPSPKQPLFKGTVA